MTDFPADLSVYARYTWMVLQEVAKGAGRTVEPASLAVYFPVGHADLIVVAIKELERAKMVQHHGGRVRLVTETRADLVAEFKDWWDMYPGRRRIKKAKVMEKYIRHRQQGVTSAQMFEGLQRWRDCKDWLKDDGEYVMAPEVWLNGGCWDDHPAPAGPSRIIPPEHLRRPWLQSYLKHVQDPEKPKSWEMVNFAASLGLGAKAEEAAWMLKSQGVVAAAEWVWMERAQ